MLHNGYVDRCWRISEKRVELGCINTVGAACSTGAWDVKKREDGESGLIHRKDFHYTAPCSEWLERVGSKLNRNHAEWHASVAILSRGEV